jgi:hypothetical protein
MAEDFKVEVPISIKGGREGEKVGKQIGNKIAESLKKSLKSVGFGGSKSSATSGASQAAGLLGGMTKGLAGVAVKIGIVGVTLAATLGILKKSSGYLRGVLSIFERSFMIFFRPFGDFLATLLRPLAIMLMKVAVGWLKWTRESSTGKALFGGGEDTAASGAIKTGLKGSTTGFTGILGSTISSALAKVDWGSVGTWLWEKIITIWDWTNDVNSWLWEKITSIWDWTYDYAGWIWGVITSVWNYDEDYGEWLWGKITSIWNWTFDFSSWLWGKVTSIWDWSWNLGSWLWRKITDALSDVGSYFGFGNSKGYATGTAFVPETGLAMLHRGESVIPRVQNNNNSASSIILKPTIQIMGGGSNFDADEAARRFTSLTMMELKSRGII